MCGAVIINNWNVKMHRLVFTGLFLGSSLPQDQMKSLRPKGSTLSIFVPSQGMRYSKKITPQNTKDKMCFTKNEEEAEIYNSRPWPLRNS